MDDGYSYDDPDTARAKAMFKFAFGEAYGTHLARQVHEGAVGINRFIMCDIGPRVWMRDKLDMKIRMFVAIASLQTLGRDDVKFFMRGAFANGATREEIEEVLIVAGMESGFPSAARAARHLDEAEREHIAFMAEWEAEQAAKGAESAE